MSYTKRQFVESAYAELGLAKEVYALSPGELNFAVERLDGLMQMWNAKGIRLAWPTPSSPEDGSLDEETNVMDRANMAIYLALAVALAPSFGKQVSPDTKTQARTAYNGLLAYFSQPVEMKYPDTMPIGAGYKRWRNQDTPFVRQTERNPEMGPDAFIDTE